MNALLRLSIDILRNKYSISFLFSFCSIFLQSVLQVIVILKPNFNYDNFAYFVFPLVLVFLKFSLMYIRNRL